VHQQFKEMSAQTELLRLSAKQARSEAQSSSLTAASQLDLVRQQVAAAQNSARAIQRQMRVDQRPRIKVELVGGEPAPGAGPKDTQPGTLNIFPDKPWNLKVRFTNTGKTAAQNLSGAISIQLVAKGKKPYIPKHKLTIVLDGQSSNSKFPAIPAQGFQASLVYAGDSFEGYYDRVRVTGDGKIVSSPLSFPEGVGLSNKSMYLVIWGEVTYMDVFGFEHWTRFCGGTDVEGGSIPSKRCASYSSVDSN